MSESLFQGAAPASNSNQNNGAPGITTATRIRILSAGTVTQVGWRCSDTAPASASWNVVRYVAATDSAGANLASGTFSSLTAGQWNYASTSISLAAGDEIVVEVWNSEGRYVNSLGFFNTDVTIGNLLGPADDAVTPRRNGRFDVGGSLAFPVSGFNGNGYHVDIVFEVATTARPIVVTPALVRQRPVAPLLSRSSLADVVVATTATPQPLVVTSPRTRPTPGQPIAIRSTLADPPVLTTPQPLVVVASPPKPTSTVITARSSLVDVVAPSAVTPQPIVVTPLSRTQAPAEPIVLRSSLVDLATPQPYVVTPSSRRMLVAPPILLRSSLADVVVATATPQPVVVVPTMRRVATATVVVVAAPAAGTPAPVIGDRPEYAVGHPYTSWRTGNPYTAWMVERPETAWRAMAPRGGG